MPRSLLLAGLDAVPFVEYRQGFTREGFQVDSAYRQEHAAAMMAMNDYDAVIVFSRSTVPIVQLLEALSASLSTVPVVLCICPADVEAEETLLEAGATGCRPVNIRFNELLAQIRALLRRVSGYPRHYRIGDLGIDPIGRRASRRGIPLLLRPREFDLLLHLAESEGQIVRKETLMAQLWPKKPASANLLARHMRNLRLALETGYRTRLLHTIPNQGYVLSEAPVAHARSSSRSSGRRRARITD